MPEVVKPEPDFPFLIVYSVLISAKLQTSQQMTLKSNIKTRVSVLTVVSKFLFWQFPSRQRRQMVHLGALSKPRATELSKSKGFQLRPLKIPINTNWPSCVCQGMQLHEYQVNPALPPFFLPCHLPAAPAAISQQHGAAAEPAGSRGWFEPWAPSPASPLRAQHSALGVWEQTSQFALEMRWQEK